MTGIAVTDYKQGTYWLELWGKKAGAAAQAYGFSREDSF